MISVRLAEPEDAEDAISVVRDSIRFLCTADHGDDPETLASWLANKTPENFRGWLANADNVCVVSEWDGQVRGVGLLHRSGEIRLFYLAPGAQRRGIGRMIHAALERAAIEQGLASLRLDSTSAARPFYEAMGYRPAGPVACRFGVLHCYPYLKPLPAMR